VAGHTARPVAAPLCAPALWGSIQGHGYPAAGRVTRLFSLEQRAQLRGRHARRLAPVAGMSYIAGVWALGDVCPQDPAVSRGHRAAVTIAEMDLTAPTPTLHVVRHVAWAGPALGDGLTPVLRPLAAAWRLERIALGLSQAAGPIERLLGHGAPPSAVDLYPAAGRAAAALGAGLLRAITAGRVKTYAGPSAESSELWAQIVKARRRVGPDGSLELLAGPGADEWLLSLALAVEAGRGLLAPSQGRLADLVCA
jgi:hypothetical protein